MSSTEMGLNANVKWKASSIVAARRWRGYTEIDRRESKWLCTRNGGWWWDLKVIKEFFLLGCWSQEKKYKLFTRTTERRKFKPRTSIEAYCFRWVKLYIWVYLWSTMCKRIKLWDLYGIVGERTRAHKKIFMWNANKNGILHFTFINALEECLCAMCGSERCKAREITRNEKHWCAHSTSSYSFMWNIYSWSAK